MSTSAARIPWPKVWRILGVLFFVAVLTLLASRARAVDWPQVWEAVRGYRAASLAAGAGLALLSYLLYTGFDLLGRYYTRHTLPRHRVMTVAFISYAFNLNFGGLIGGAGFRYRLYSRLGLGTGTTSRVLGLSILTNWLGYVALAGIVFTVRVVELPPDWTIGTDALQLIGVGLVLSVFAYLLLCARARRRTWTLRGHDIELPPLRIAGIQLALSMSNWLVMAVLVTLLMPDEVAFATVLGVLLISAVAAAMTHIPAGLGVLEAVFFVLLGHQVTQPELLAVLLTYRALYYLAPLAIAAVAYFLLEARAARSKGAAARSVR